MEEILKVGLRRVGAILPSDWRSFDSAPLMIAAAVTRWFRYPRESSSSGVITMTGRFFWALALEMGVS